MTLLVILTINLSEVIGFTLSPKKKGSGINYIPGYILASLNIILISRISKFQHKLVGIVITIGAQIGIIVQFPPFKTPQALITTMCMLIVAILTVVFYSREKNERRIFKDFYEKREELLKFKELLSESLPQGISVISCDSTKQLFTNKAWLNTFEQHQTRLDQSNITNFQHLEDIEYIKPQPDSLQFVQGVVLDGGQTSAHCIEEYSNLREAIKDLSTKHVLDGATVSLTATYQRSNNQMIFRVTLKQVKWDGINAVAIILNDITYQEKLIALKLTNQNKDKVIATVSHELRTPIHSISGFLDIIETKVDDPEALEYLSYCKDNAQLLLSLVNSILDLRQLDAGKLTVHPKRVDLYKFLTNVMRVFRFQCQQKSISLTLQINKDVPGHITTDDNRLRQIINNLLANAIKFTPSGEIRIEVADDPDNKNCVIITVADTGIGIKNEDKEHLFKMYGKLEDKKGVNKNGVGFGLNICNALVKVLCDEKENAGLQLTSEYGVGSRFYFKVLKDLEGSLSKIEGDKMLKDDSDVVLDLKKGEIQLSQGSKDEEVLDELSDRTHLRPKENNFKMLSSLAPHRITLTNSMSLPDGGCNITEKRQLDPFKERRTNLNNAIVFPAEGEKPSPLMSPFLLDDTRTLRIASQASDHGLEYIIVVDDNPFNLLIARNLLSALPYLVKTAMGGQEAIDMIKSLNDQEQSIKVIFMDCQMPVMDGYETSRMLKDLMRTNLIKTVPIVGWSANNSEEDKKRCIENGMIDQLPKPTSHEALINFISNLP